MYKQIKRKLHSRDGASISFAFFAFIVAAVVSLVIIAAALSNAVKLRQERANEQAYLVAESIAYALADQVVSTSNETAPAGSAKEYTSRYVRIAEQAGSGGSTVVSSTAATEGLDVFAEPFKSVTENLCKARYEAVKAGTSGLSVNATASTDINIQVSNIVAASGNKLSDSVADTINSGDTKISCYMPEAKLISTGGEINYDVADYYDMEYLIEVPISAGKVYKCRLHMDAAIKSNGSALYVYWPTYNLLKGAE